MRRAVLVLLVIVAISAGSALADTIHLKNGSVLKGKVTSFSDDQFVVLLDTGSGKYLSRAMIYIGDVARIEFDSSPALPSGDNAMSGPQRTTPEQSSEQWAVSERERVRKPVTILPDPSPPPVPAGREEEAEPESSGAVTPTSRAGAGSEPDRSARRPTGPVKTTNVDVVGRRDWTSSGVIVRRGDRVRITATGTVVLDQATGASTGPEGIEQEDARKLLPEHPTGGLIAVIGADNDDFIFIGRSAEFTATREGLLFLSVNEGNLSDNIGAFKATVEVESSRSGSR